MFFSQSWPFQQTCYGVAAYYYNSFYQTKFLSVFIMQNWIKALEKTTERVFDSL